jgi:arabinofuranosyltransferase
MLWILGTLEVGRGSDLRGWLCMSSGAAAAALTRPDGLLLVLSSLGLLALGLLRGVARKNVLVGAAPLLVVPAHLLWRRGFYGEWLPNTYYAKHVRIWPDAGVRYVESFVLEHAVWTWLLLALAVAIVEARRINRAGLEAGALQAWLSPCVVVLTLLAHVAYYVLIIGGDHFEYRILAHLVVPLGMALVALLVRLPIRPAFVYVTLLLVVAPGIPIPWIHYVRSNTAATRAQSHLLVVTVADALPAGPLRTYGEAFDRLQAWLIPHHVGTRQREHKVFAADETNSFIARAEGEQIKWRQHAVIAAASVGMLGWLLPEVAVIDMLGLNDWVVARHPVPDNGFRAMAHERQSPLGYVECYKPDVAMDYAGGRVLHWSPRASPLTDPEIVACEDRFMALAKTWPQE